LDFINQNWDVKTKEDVHLTNDKLHLTNNNWDVEPYLTNETCDLTDTNCHLITQNWDLTDESLDSADLGKLTSQTGVSHNFWLLILSK
jgi:hypothetical protein